MLFDLLPSEGGKAEQAVELNLLFPRNGDVPGLLLSLLLAGQTPEKHLLHWQIWVKNHISVAY